MKSNSNPVVIYHKVIFCAFFCLLILTLKQIHTPKVSSPQAKMATHRTLLTTITTLHVGVQI